MGEFRPAESVLDPIYARALILDSGDKKICFLSIDLTIITREWTEKIRTAAARQCGIEPDAVMVHVTQTHSAPSLGHFMVDESFQPMPEGMEWLRGGDPRYFDFALERIVEAIRAANDSLEPVQVGVGSGIEGRMAFNRRAVGRDGKVHMPGRNWTAPLGPTNIRHMEGPIDPEVGVFCTKSVSGRMVSMLLHYTCHPVHVFPKQIISADWPGAWADEMNRSFGDSCTPLVLNGCCGNINPWPPFDPDYDEDHNRMGSILAETTRKVIDSMEFKDGLPLDWRLRRLRLPIREIEPELLTECEKILSETPQPKLRQDDPRRVEWDWMRAASIYSVHLHRQREAELEYEIQAFRIGDAAFVGLPGEPFVEGQLRIKIASPASRTYIAHCTSQYVGYLPIQEAFPRGGHEVETRYWAKLEPEALDMVVEGTIGLLQELLKES